MIEDFSQAQSTMSGDLNKNNDQNFKKLLSEKFDTNKFKIHFDSGHELAMKLNLCKRTQLILSG